MDNLKLYVKIQATQIATNLGIFKRSDALHYLANLYVGHEASPTDLADDDVACAESVCAILANIIPFPAELSTYRLFQEFKKNEVFERIAGKPQEGDIIISPTGTGNGSIAGHVGIVGTNDSIYSNTSADGIWRQNYNLESWKSRYVRLGGMHMFYFRLK